LLSAAFSCISTTHKIFSDESAISFGEQLERVSFVESILCYDFQKAKGY
jgi:hypothetical protein